MNKRFLIVIIPVAVLAVAVFLVFQNMRTPDNDQNRSPSSEPSVADEPGNVMPEISMNGSRDKSRKAGDNASITDELQEKYAAVSDNPDYPQLQSRLDAMRQRQPNRSFDAEQVVEAMAQSEAWARVDTPHDDLPLTPEEKFDGREFIRFNPSRIEALMPGDTLEIPIWQLGERYTMRVDYAETHPNGSVTWHGHLENFNDPHRVTITVGDGLSLGGIDTPGGHYVLQAHNESGWIASSETLFKRNESEPDMIIPPAGELEESP